MATGEPEASKVSGVDPVSLCNAKTVLVALAP
jgi:hypothetical protein